MHKPKTLSWDFYRLQNVQVVTINKVLAKRESFGYSLFKMVICIPLICISNWRELVETYQLENVQQITHVIFCKLSPHITSVQYCGGCSVHWRLFSTSGG